MSRDPIEERGGVNVYEVVGNDGVNQWDFLGTDWDGLKKWWTDGFDSNVDKCKCAVEKVGESIVETDARLGKCCDDLVKSLGINTKWARTVDLSLNFTAGAGGTAGFDAVFFADSCEIALFGVVPREGLPSDSWLKNLDIPSLGLDAGISLTGSVAYYSGAEPIANWKTWKGAFESVNVGVEFVSAGYYWGSGWKGVQAGGALGTPVSGSYNKTDYRRIKVFPVPKSVCCALRLKGPSS